MLKLDWNCDIRLLQASVQYITRHSSIDHEDAKILG